MGKEKIKYSLISIISLILFALIALCSYANRITEDTDIIMPSMYIVEGMMSWYVMLLGIIAEAVLIRLVLKETYLKSVAITLIMNLVSIILGVVAIHIVGLIVEVLFLLFEYGTFHVSHWIVNFLLIILLNASLEGLTVKLIFKHKFKKIFSWLCLANAISFMICILFNLSWMGEMFF